MIKLADDNWEVNQLVKTGLYPHQQAVFRDALRALYTVKPQIKLKLIAFAYSNGEISLGRAAEILGVSQEEVKEILWETGISLHFGPETIAELQKDIANAK
jgi:predicted HTH domain antitoxin